MTEASKYWAGSSTGDCGPYTDDDFSDIWRKYFTNDRTTQGVLGNYENELAITNPAGVTIRQATGAAIVDGKFYESTANVDHTVTVPGSGSNYYRVVLRKDFTAQTVRSVLLGPNVAAPDAVTQSDGTTWEISLATVEITSGSVVTVTDTRDWVQPNLLKPDDSTLEYNSDGELQFINGTVAADQISNRTRKFLVPVSNGYNTTDTTWLLPSSSGKSTAMPDNKDCYGIGQFYCPSDFSSTMTIDTVWQADASGNIYCRSQAYHGAEGEAIGNHNVSSGGLAAEAATQDDISLTDQMSMTDMAAGDYVSIISQRDSTNAADTISNTVYLIGWLVSYTADS